MNSRVLEVGEFKYTIVTFKGTKGVATATKLTQKSAKIALISVLCKRSRNVTCEYRVFGVHELKYVSQVFKGAKGVSMTTKFRQNMPKLHLF